MQLRKNSKTLRSRNLATGAQLDLPKLQKKEESDRWRAGRNNDEEGEHFKVSLSLIRLSSGDGTKHCACLALSFGNAGIEGSTDCTSAGRNNLWAIPVAPQLFCTSVIREGDGAPQTKCPQEEAAQIHKNCYNWVDKVK